jgi:hypothetical protein
VWAELVKTIPEGLMLEYFRYELVRINLGNDEVEYYQKVMDMVSNQVKHLDKARILVKTLRFSYL